MKERLQKGRDISLLLEGANAPRNPLQVPEVACRVRFTHHVADLANMTMVRETHPTILNCRQVFTDL